LKKLHSVSEWLLESVKPMIVLDAF